ncbi:MAG TPA: recombination mediator RecR [Acetomicrobium flavidum]|uniref:recombination mediator RecR n=1 Tax=Acetomicrobium flavidum TaxID=49896 RepID=UPI002C9823BC|nr:recombination mediator RecR [Acetomicrobium flavidum]HOP87118.1 recombination mediator RecR [Acetomicrobium flavidum]HPU68159.1 recombination mediator RecR [Acetomicrobium flavidum]
MALSKPLEDLMRLFERFPGIGEKSARRMVLFLLQQPKGFSEALAEGIRKCSSSLHPCSICGNITDDDPCSICSDPFRDKSTLCIVESVEDLITLEQAGIYNGLYFVLGMLYSPLEGEEVSPEVLERLVKRVSQGDIKEVILAFSPKVEGELTMNLITSVLDPLPVTVSRLSYGLPVGGSVSFADRTTLHAALEARTCLKRGEGRQ